jgi:hypothetical protein
MERRPRPHSRRLCGGRAIFRFLQSIAICSAAKIAQENERPGRSYGIDCMAWESVACLTVIPAKAGIHGEFEAWIPAFAGMTIRFSQ